MTMWAETTAGHATPSGSPRSSLEGYFYKPRADKEILTEHAGAHRRHRLPQVGAIQTRLRLGQYDRRSARPASLQDIPGATTSSSS